MYRMQVYDTQITGLPWRCTKSAARHGQAILRTRWRRFLSPGGQNGGGRDPAYTFAATAPPLTDGIDEILFGRLYRQETRRSPCETVTLEVPADVDVRARRLCAPGTWHEGAVRRSHRYYYSVGNYPVFQPTASRTGGTIIIHNDRCGIPPMEDFYMGGASVRYSMPVFSTM